MNKLAQPKRRHDLNVYDYPSSSTRTSNVSSQSTGFLQFWTFILSFRMIFRIIRERCEIYNSSRQNRFWLFFLLLEKSMKRKLINSSEESRNIEDLGKKKNLLDSYARITATRNRRCPKRLLDLAKPMRNYICNEDSYGNFDKNYYNPVKTFAPKINSTFGGQQKR